MEFEKLKKIIAEVLNVDPDEITMETTFQDDLGADSLGCIPDHHGYRGRVRYRDPCRVCRAGYYCRRSSRDDQERSELVKLRAMQK